MNRLIKNELAKVFKKKSIYILLIVTFAFVILTNVIYKYAYSNLAIFDEYGINAMKEELKTLDPEKPEDVQEYLMVKSQIDLYDYSKEYDSSSWQYALIQEKGMQYVYDVNNYTYVEKNETELEKAKKDLDSFIQDIKQGEWKKIVQEEIDILKAQDIQDEPTKMQIEELQMRLDYNIEYGNNYKNTALSLLFDSKLTLVELEEKNNKTYREKIEYQNAKEQLEINKYIIENDVDIANSTNSRGILLNVFSEYSIFIIIGVVLISGTIVSEEFNKGTIKLLLVRPYSRNKILFAKFITILITMLVIILAVIVMQLIVGIIFTGAQSLKIQQVVYNHKTEKIEEVNIALAVLKEGLGKLPMYILIATLAFSSSILFNNTAVAITMSLLGYTASGIINQITYSLNVKWIKYFVTPNWDLSQMFNGKLHELEGINMTFALVICLIYFLIMIIPSFIVFKKKNIKNI